ncbi:DotD/TraH family lipoprotein [Paucibacter soli]|uniref:DotD/TraH family lipoprotein n=1 Tax=Paucibacter soli TaxID=3133433 RepID=UPI0030AA3BDC
MKRHSSLLLAMAILGLAGCATSPAPALIERDPVDGLIASNAAVATQALRELSEASGSSRVVAAQKPTREVSAPAPQPTQVNPPRALSMAARGSAIAVDADAPRAPAFQYTPQVGQSIIAGSSGVVASGGLLSVPPAGLERLITVRWTGELEQLLSRVAQEAGWQMGAATGFRVVPVVISISADNRSAFDLLRDIGAIAGTSADILVSESNRTISVRYLQR